MPLHRFYYSPLSVHHVVFLNLLQSGFEPVSLHGHCSKPLTAGRAEQNLRIRPVLSRLTDETCNTGSECRLDDYSEFYVKLD